MEIIQSRIPFPAWKSNIQQRTNLYLKAAIWFLTFFYSLLMLRSLFHRSLCLPKHSLPIAYFKSGPRYFHRSIMAEAQSPNVGTLSPLSRADRDTYARMAETMEMFHNSFRQTWKILYDACCSGKRPSNMSIRHFLSTGCDFCHHLNMHHSIG